MGRLTDPGRQPLERLLRLGQGVADGAGERGPGAAAVGEEVGGQAPPVRSVGSGLHVHDEPAVGLAGGQPGQPGGGLLEREHLADAHLQRAGGRLLHERADDLAQRAGHDLRGGDAGGVGSYAVQLLAAQGVTVIATGKPESADRLRQLGATTVIDHHSADVVEHVRAAHPDGVDALVNVGGFDPAGVPVRAVREGGKLASTTAVPDDDTLAAAGVTGTSIMARPLREVVQPLVEQVAAGTLKVSVADVLPFDQAVTGLATLAAGKANGKLVVRVED